MICRKMQARPHPIVRFRRLDPSRRWLLVRFGAAPLGITPTDVDACIGAIQAAASRLPWRAVCIEQGLAAQRMLRQGGIEARLHYGIRNAGASAKLEAHVWVSVDGRTIIGGREAPDFAEVAVYP